ncbi:MAG TPA: tetratricopeptide repeat protein [Thermoplasmatales archaeon]|nr:tetratricopeptide repeat protein [Thermoplasmatales archaeon]
MKEDEYENFMEKVGEKIIEGDYEEAIKFIDDVIKKNDDERIWITKGTILMDLNEMEDAIKCFDKALEINANNDFAIAFKGVTLYRIGEENEGEKCFDEVLSMNPKNFIALYWKGVVEGKKGRKENEIELKGKAAFILFTTGGDVESFNLFREVYYSGVDMPIRYECGVAYAGILDYILMMRKDKKLEEEYDAIVLDCWKNREKICKSAQILLADMMGEEVEEEIVVNDEKDFVFKKLFETWFNEMEG